MARPTGSGDIFGWMNGKKTIEIRTFDAEGRLALADAGPSYAAKEGYSPISLDIANTWTGGWLVAPSGKRGGLFSNDDAVRDGLDGGR